MIRNFNKNIYIKGKLISLKSPTFVIAEAGVNHGGDMAVAKQLIDLAVEAKADAVKFQYFKSEYVVLKNAQKAPYQKKTTDSEESQFYMLKKLEIIQATILAKPLNFASNIAGLIVFFSFGHIAFIIGLIMMLGQLIGAFFGTHYLLKANPRVIRILIVVLSISMLARYIYSMDFYLY